MIESNMASTMETGNKARFLTQLKENGFHVPEFNVLDSQLYKNIIHYNKKSEYIENRLAALTKENISKISQDITQSIKECIIPDNISLELAEMIDHDKQYAVRSSGTKEDLEGYSFAGQYETFLHVSGVDKIKQAILGCYKSMFEKENLSYLLDNKLDIKDLSMAVIIQEMVQSDVSGIGFTVNPLTGNDKQIVVEVAKGQGELIVGGRVNPEKYMYNWFDETFDYSSNNTILDRGEFTKLSEVLLSIQVLFGYPCDVEFAYEAGQLYILQARPITKIMYSEILDQWTTANFKDGGVSATVCKPFMWSLYEYVWEIILKKFLLDAKLVKKHRLRKLGMMYYGRPYWNLSIVKEAMSKVPGYKERDFDSELGVTITYNGNGNTTKISPKSILGIIPIALAQSKLNKVQRNNVSSDKENLMEKYHWYLEENKNPTKDVENVWYQLIKTDYLQSECTYFWQIFMNTVGQPLYKRNLPSFMSNGNYLDLLGGMQHISHLAPFHDIWRISRMIRSEEVSYNYWVRTTIKELEQLYYDQGNDYSIEELRSHTEQYGYHSESELDVSYPCYCEEVEKVIKIVKETVLLEDCYSPEQDNEAQHKKYLMQLEHLKKNVSPKRYKKLLRKTENIREMLWWREELKDISIRFYYIVRAFTVRLAKKYYENGTIHSVDDIWYLKINDIFDFMNQKKDSEDLARFIKRNRIYYQSFRNYMSENEIGVSFQQETKKYRDSQEGITGIGCNTGIVTGTARVVEDITQIDQLKAGDILVTKFTDTGWTSRMAILSGIVTERGGVLCHASIIAREYGIPCIVSCYDVTKLIPNGSQITINGETGEVLIHK